MDITTYETITGTTVATADTARVTAVINKVQRMLEAMLGYTLDITLADTNEYTELGKTASECPCGEIDLDTLLAPDAVAYAYRLYDYNPSDKYLSIDPCLNVSNVKLVRGGITLKTLDIDEYMVQTRQGVSKYLEMCPTCLLHCLCNCKCVQLAVDAEWLWDTTLPDDLLDVWAEMITFYSDNKKDIKSESLGTHSYTRTSIAPETLSANLTILQKYAGANGSLSTLPV
jgi:hypothetical protein